MRSEGLVQREALANERLSKVLFLIGLAFFVDAIP
jgi:hypothetical protein